MKTAAQAMQFEKAGQMKVRTKAIKDLEAQAFSKLPSSTIIYLAIKELWKRHSADFYTVGFFTELAIIFWIKLG